ncbi:NurA domain-containing protein [Shewanella khirikhana]|uniref:NurA domain protein n=1 Tax=Shewanella khirikhana TaxID=1965282 RepID=A0ABN5TSH3_9GAMM|nr:NurA domain-containing protein [Shewanella khirikhana]AZQ09207.1 NurA domain protein [Shewanella khirikhana]
MAYSSGKGYKPFESASKSAHSQLINDPKMKSLLENCRLPIKKNDIELQSIEHHLIRGGSTGIDQIVVIDGGYTDVEVDKGYPSSNVCFFQFGAMMLKMSDLKELDSSKFIDPEDIAKLNKIDRLKLVLPSNHVCRKDCRTLTETISKTLFEFFLSSDLGDSSNLCQTLKWLLFSEYLPNEERKDGSTFNDQERDDKWILASCPHCSTKDIELYRSNFEGKFLTPCTACGEEIRITDVFRLHEAVDDILGAGGVMGYVTSATEQLMLAHIFKLLKAVKPDLLKNTLFLKDGPLSFPGQTANIHKPMRRMVSYLEMKYGLKLAGVEKSGQCVEHASLIEGYVKKGTALILSTPYLYKYVYPGDPNSKTPFGSTSYYGGKIIFKSDSENMYVVTLPMQQKKLTPSVSDYRYLDKVLNTIARLKCDMYDSALIPVAMANKLVSLADLPSSKILQRFAKEAINGNSG